MTLWLMTYLFLSKVLKIQSVNVDFVIEFV